MQELKKRLRWGDVIIIMIIASLTFMFIPAWIPFLRKGWMLLIFATVIILLNWSSYISKPVLISLFVYGIILIFNVLFGDVYIGSMANAIYEFLVLFVLSSLALYYIRSSNKKLVHSLVYVTLIALLIELVASFIVMETNPGLIRSLYGMSKAESDPYFMYGFYKLGLMDYSMAHAIPILVPSLFYHIKEGARKDKWVCLLLISACIFLIWLSESSTALMLVVLVVFMGLLINKKAPFKRNVFVILFMMIVAALLMSNDDILTGIFDVLKKLVGENSIYRIKIEELQLSFVEDETTGDLKGRMERYRQSINMFYSNVLLGSNRMPGRHAALLDKLATLGLIGFVPLVLFLIFSLKAIWISIPQNCRIYYLESIIAALLMLLFKGMWVWPVFLFLFLVSPCILVMKQDGR